MSLLTVDREKCKRDGICAEICPMGIIEFKDKDAFPTLTDGGNKLCISCGHCVAVCPHGAMSHVIMKSEGCPPVKEDWLFGPEQVEHFLRHRRSIRIYKKKQVEREVLTKLINVARFAPSGHNRQPVKWLVINERDEVQRITGFVVHWMRHLIKEDSPLVAAMNLNRVVGSWEKGNDPILELAASSFDLGACWAGYFNAAATFWPPMQEELGLPEGNVSFGSMMVGYPKFKYHRLPLRNDAEIMWR